MNPSENCHILKALRDEEGELIGYSKICLDDTARKHLEDACASSRAPPPRVINTDLAPTYPTAIEGCSAGRLPRRCRHRPV